MKVYVQIFEDMDSRTKKRWECFVIARSPKTLARIAGRDNGFFRSIGKPYAAYATPCLMEILSEDSSHDAIYVSDTEDYIYR